MNGQHEDPGLSTIPFHPSTHPSIHPDYIPAPPCPNPINKESHACCDTVGRETYRKAHQERCVYKKRKVVSVNGNRSIGPRRKDPESVTNDSAVSNRTIHNIRTNG